MAVSTNHRDKYSLYEKAVQNPPAEVSFFNRVYQRLRGRKPRVLREDFCGTGAVTCAWARQGSDRMGYGIDLDGPTLKWGREHNVAPLGKRAAQARLVKGNVLHRFPFKADIIAALNFSYFTFKDRSTMLRYAQSALSGLKRGGVFILDIYGGPDAQTLLEEEVEHDDFTYIWDQSAFNPIKAHILCYIHFELPGGKTLRRAFTYDWRLWSLPEMKDILREAGFKGLEVYWEGTDHDSGEGNGIFRPSKRGDDSESWIAYIVAEK